MPSGVIIDDDTLTRLGLRSLLEQEFRGMVLHEANIAKEALLEVARRPAELIILALNGPHAAHLLEEIRRRHPTVPVLVMSRLADPRHAALVRRLGANGYCAKDASRADLLRAIRNVLAGNDHFDDRHLLDHPETIFPDLKSLSPREYRVMLALTRGERATDIAAELNLSIKTVSTYKRRVLNKLKLDSVADLVRHMIDLNLS